MDAPLRNRGGQGLLIRIDHVGNLLLDLELHHSIGVDARQHLRMTPVLSISIVLTTVLVVVSTFVVLVETGI